MQRRESRKSYYFSRAMEKESSGALSMKKYMVSCLLASWRTTMTACVCWPEREHPGHGFRVETPVKIVSVNEICWNAGVHSY